MRAPAKVNVGIHPISHVQAAISQAENVRIAVAGGADFGRKEILEDGVLECRKPVCQPKTERPPVTPAASRLRTVLVDVKATSD